MGPRRAGQDVEAGGADEADRSAGPPAKAEQSSHPDAVRARADASREWGRARAFSRASVGEAAAAAAAGDGDEAAAAAAGAEQAAAAAAAAAVGRERIDVAREQRI